MPNPIEFARDRALEQIKYASSTVSQNARTIGIALALVVYALAFGEDKRDLLETYRVELLAAAVCGVACVLLDYLQYYFMIRESRSVLGTLEEQKKRIMLLHSTAPTHAKALATDFLAGADTIGDKTWSAFWREVCFHMKFFAAAAGSLIIIWILWHVLFRSPM